VVERGVMRYSKKRKKSGTLIPRTPMKKHEQLSVASKNLNMKKQNAGWK